MGCTAAVGSARRARRGFAVAVCLALLPACRRARTSADASSESEAAWAWAILTAELPPPPPPVPVAPPPPPPPSAEEAGSCPPNGDETTGLVVSTLHAVAGSPLRILTATLVDPEPLAFRLETSKGDPVEADVVYRSGVPAMTVARLVPKRTGDLRVIVGRHGKGLRCTSVRVHAHPASKKPRDAREEAVWSVVRNWNRGEEALYSAWIREMFHAPRGEELAFGRFDEVTSNPDRNLLFDHYGWAEDSARTKGLKLKPDCADTPYFMRAYFAWKRALPFAYRHCSSGDETSPPRCGKPRTVLEPPDLPSKMPEEWNE